MAIRIDQHSDRSWVYLRLTAEDEPAPVWDPAAPQAAGPDPAAVIAVQREAMERIAAEDPRPPEVLWPLLARRAVRRMPVPNGDNGVRVITTHNLSLVWP
ncbi:conserved protein of unknown function [Candidatus Hydrogenisulfobacillus filiaventi]|uniref:Uncharacterized protein n=1 Tax=Candidatus Hydrogenisulfobacillus filiaventi TaxID=2707344 RepID=A0A6F8ZKJ0_9FIRM|nr:hypothetical protein [Bacillota bacterium]CAB1130186.1 conserved protein of unknown function [Candidatus Hydrogenisulfobacillus filiaventi]